MPIPRIGDAYNAVSGRAVSSNGNITCLVADDHPAVLEAVAQFLAQSGIEVVGRARDGDEALDQIERLRPRLALIDVRMPRLGGIELARQARRSTPETAIVLYTGYSERTLLTEGLDAGVDGLVLKEAPLEDLLRAVRSVAAGGTYVDPVLAGMLATKDGGRRKELTSRERDVLRLLAAGLSNEEIGGRLFISSETVRTHIRKAMAKLGAETRTQAVALALREQLIA